MIAENIQNKFPQVVLKTEKNSSGDVVWVDARFLRDVVKALKHDWKFDLLIDVVAIDWQNRQPNRFEVDYLFYSLEWNARVTLKVVVASEAKPELDSIVAIYPAADWAEREVFDMMGIGFKGHPNLKRLLMWTDFVGHPLRKDYNIEKRQPIPVLDDIV